MGFFFLNRISHKEREERMQRIRKGKRHKRYSSSSSSHNSCSLVDRLPDEILVHILSLMSTRDSVRSSILGKRWRFLWARVPNLKLDSGDHKTLTSLKDFFNRFVFVHKGHNIHTLRIAYDDDEDMDGTSEYISEIEILIDTAIECNVQVIDIESDFELVLPQALFTCKTLVDLTLNYICDEDDILPMVPITGTSSVVYLPALKKLKIDGFRYESEKSLVHLLSGCPALEELTVIKNDDHVDCVFVSSPTLTRLNLEIGCAANYKTCEVKLDTPALKYLRLHDSSSQNFSAGMLGSLTEADVAFDAPAAESVDLNSRFILEFVSKLNNVSCLILSVFLKKVPDSAWTDSTLTRTEFRNLTKLELDGDWRFLTTFLQNSDNLRVLSVDMLLVDKHQYWMEPKQVPVCLIYHLRTVNFSNFNCSDPELNLVKYVLKNAEVLTMMKIRVTCCSRDLKKNKEALERITLFERASEACQFTFEFD